MKKALLLCMVLLASLPRETHADSTTAASRRMRNAGIAITAIGGVLALSGVALAISRQAVGDYPRDGLGLLGGSALWLGVSSIPLLGAGIPLWAVGDARMKGRDRMASLAITPLLDGNQRGGRATLTIRF